MGQSVNLRTMTMLSRMNFGKFSDKRVCDVIKHHSKYLQWVYFNASQVSFNEEVLARLGITDEWKIAKPGKDEVLWESFPKAEPTEEELKFRKNMGAKMAKVKRNNAYKAEKVFSKKGNLQARNHGH